MLLIKPNCMVVEFGEVKAAVGRGVIWLRTKLKQPYTACAATTCQDAGLEQSKEFAHQLVRVVSFFLRCAEYKHDGTARSRRDGLDSEKAAIDSCTRVAVDQIVRTSFRAAPQQCVMHNDAAWATGVFVGCAAKPMCRIFLGLAKSSDPRVAEHARERRSTKHRFAAPIARKRRSVAVAARARSSANRKLNGSNKTMDVPTHGRSPCA